MPSWGEILRELQQSAAPTGAPDFDGVRRKYLIKLHELTGRPVFLYWTNWMSGQAPGTATMITLEDMQGFMEVCREVAGPNLDIVLHSPGGIPEATASIVRYLRQKFSDIRVFVPLAAMSAATMLALASDRIVMGKHSQLGPIDPQLQAGTWTAPARGILEQFERAKQECRADPAALAAWAPILQQYGPALLEQCRMAEDLAKRLVTEWLIAYMFKGDSDKAERVAEFFASYELHQSHSMGIPREMAREQGLAIEDLEANQELQDAVLSVHHAAMLTPAVKLIENHKSRTYAKVQAAAQIVLPMGPAPPATPPGLAPS
ncbi:MAG: SDH family Clp fold serine proteinase [Acidimicrobiales bacterium]